MKIVIEKNDMTTETFHSLLEDMEELKNDYGFIYTELIE